jgi:hypothetical protein
MCLTILVFIGNKRVRYAGFLFGNSNAECHPYLYILMKNKPIAGLGYFAWVFMIFLGIILSLLYIFGTNVNLRKKLRLMGEPVHTTNYSFSPHKVLFISH